MNISSPFIRRPVMTTFVMLAILIAGIMAFRKLPVSDLPNIEYPSIGVSAYYTGASPETMVNMVTKPLERELVNVKGLKEMSSTSSQGSTSITLEFHLGKDLEEASREVQAALNRAENSLPDNMDQRPSYYKQEGSQEHIMYLLLNSSTESVAAMREYADLYITPRFSRIEGVAGVDTFGAPFSVKVRLNPDIMASRQIGLNQVIKAIKEYNSDLPLGTIETGTKKLTIELPSKFTQASDFEDLIVAEGPIKLKDIATITDGNEDEDEFHYLTKTENLLSLALGIKKVSGANTVGISNAINAAMPEIKKELPPSMDFILWFDKAVWINESIVDVQWSLAFAFILVVVVIFFSLGRMSETLIPSVALPMSLIGTFVAMYWLDYSLDILSLLALTLAVGFVVDDAIVVLENIVRHSEQGKSPLEASLIGSKEICFTILSMTISLVVVFIPLLFMSGMTGVLFHEFSVTLAFAIIVSGIVSLTLTPMLCSRWLTSHSKETRIQRGVAKVNQWMLGWYGSSLKWCIKHPKTILVVAVACFAAIVPLFKTLPIDLFPKEDRGFLFSIVSLPTGLSKDKAMHYQKKIETLIQNNSAIDSFIDFTMEGNQLYVVKLLPHHERIPQNEVIGQIQAGVDSIPGTQGFTLAWQLINVDLDIGAGGDYQYQLRGMNANEVNHAADLLKNKLQGNPDFPFVRLSTRHDDPKLVVEVQEERARQYGFTTFAIQSLIQQAFSGASIANINKDGNQYKVYLSLQDSYRKSPKALSFLYLQSPDNTPVPLKSLASWKEVLGSPSLFRVDQLPTVAMNFALAKGIALNEGLAKLEQIANETIPSTVKGRLQGSAAMVASAAQDTGLLLLTSALVMYIILGILYESFVHPLTILSSLPFAGLGGVLTLILFNEPLSIYSIVGFLLLIGIVKKNGIMIVDFALEARKDPKVTAEEAIYQGSLVRFRPIMMTTIAAIMGAVPIAVGFGVGAETRRGLGLVIVGGLLFSQLLILYVTPVIYIVFEKLFHRKPKVVLRESH